jgi:hypothetical protein
VREDEDERRVRGVEEDRQRTRRITEERKQKTKKGKEKKRKKKKRVRNQAGSGALYMTWGGCVGQGVEVEKEVLN